MHVNGHVASGLLVTVLWCVERAHEYVTDLVTEWKSCIKLTERQKFLKINIILCVKVGGIR